MKHSSHRPGLHVHGEKNTKPQPRPSGKFSRTTQGDENVVWIRYIKRVVEVRPSGNTTTAFITAWKVLEMNIYRCVSVDYA